MDPTCLKTVLPLKNKSEYHSWILHYQIGHGTKFQLEKTILFFETKFAWKQYFWSKAKKVSMAIEFRIVKLVKILNFSLKEEFSFLGPSLPKNSISALKHKSEHHYWIAYIQIGLNTKFQFETTIFIFCSKLAQKGYFQTKTENVNITVELCIFKVV